AIKEADVILYDALVNEELLDYAKESCTKIYVGKRAERMSTSQDYINKLLVDYALTHGHVVRLKGGDPFVFGRGGEELDYIRQFDIPTAVVPGISSSVGLTGLQQIPLTYRGISESFWVITGSTSDGLLSEDLRHAVKTNATVVVLMGYSKLQKIIELYQENGRGNLPIALIQNGSLENERLAIGTIDTIMEQVHKNLLGVPAIIVLAEVDAKHQSFLKLKQEIQHIEAVMNTLFPIFVKMIQIPTLLVGAGPVGWEKLQAILRSSPLAKVKIVAEQIIPEVFEFIADKETIQLERRSFQESDLDGKDLVVVASNNPELNKQIRDLTTKRHIMLNVADKPDLCDFYLGSIVQKGNLKIGISTNGKSPTMAKRLKEFFNEILPEEIDETLELLQEYRNQLRGDLEHKIKQLNAHTQEIVSKK